MSQANAPKHIATPRYNIARNAIADENPAIGSSISKIPQSRTRTTRSQIRLRETRVTQVRTMERAPILSTFHGFNPGVWNSIWFHLGSHHDAHGLFDVLIRFR